MTASRSLQVARLLTGAWRPAPPPLENPASALSLYQDYLMDCGAGALVWWRLRLSPWRETSGAKPFRRAYLDQSAQTAQRAARLEQLVQQLDAAGIEFLLFKGWAAARNYAEPGLRPLGDVDILVPPACAGAAERAVAHVRPAVVSVDVHASMDEYTHSSQLRADWGTLAARSETVTLGETVLRVLSPEDHLVLLCVHLLRHSAWRPVWLCDVAAALEARPADFDWDYVFRLVTHTDWIECAVGAAHELLDAKIDDTPLAESALRLPRWFVPEVLKQWDYPLHTQHPLPPAFRTVWRDPAQLALAFRLRYPPPIKAILLQNASLKRSSPRLYQLANFLTSGMRFAARRPR